MGNGFAAAHPGHRLEDQFPARPVDAAKGAFRGSFNAARCERSVSRRSGRIRGSSRHGGRRTRRQSRCLNSIRATTGSIPRAGVVTALVPQVTGAPGDGSRSLAAALRNELMRNGVKPAPPGSAAHRVEGRVKMGPRQSGQQPIKIDWVVKDPNGQSLGTVSQENKIPAGSLDGQWGGTATAAAVAATQGILKLLPKQQTASR